MSRSSRSVLESPSITSASEQPDISACRPVTGSERGAAYDAALASGLGPSLAPDDAGSPADPGQSGADRLSSHRHRVMVKAMLASVIAPRAHASPMVRMVIPMRAFWWAKTCSTFERSADFAAVARRVGFGIGRPLGLRRWMRLTMPCASSQASFSAERQALSAQAKRAVLDRGDQSLPHPPPIMPGGIGDGLAAERSHCPPLVRGQWRAHASGRSRCGTCSPRRGSRDRPASCRRCSAAGAPRPGSHRSPFPSDQWRTLARSGRPAAGSPPP